MTALHVTDVIRLAGLMPTYNGDTYAMDRGSAVHLACELHDKAIEMDPDSIVDVQGYLEAYLRWRLEMQPHIVGIEETVRHPMYGYVGRLDRRIEFPEDQLVGVLDIKTGQPAAWHGPQLSAYAEALMHDPRVPSQKRWGLYLAADGTYRFIEYKDRDDWRVFQAALSVANWKLKNGLAEWPARGE